MLKVDEVMDINVDHIMFALQPLSTPEAVDRYSNNPYECLQSLIENGGVRCEWVRVSLL
jgi:hypothetical protein